MVLRKNIATFFRFRIERVLLFVLLGLFVGAVAVYMYFISITVIQVALRQELIVAIQEKELEVSKLEATYFERVNTLSRDTATELGLVAMEPTAYVSVTPKGGRLTRND